MQKAHVFPVPFFDRTSAHFPERITGMADSCTGDGRMKFDPPFISRIPLTRSGFRYKSSHSVPCVLSTSEVRRRW